jgi:phosphatidylserine/phosphatidylglycerophosphate/cardiolipin synthase-like enzyme
VDFVAELRRVPLRLLGGRGHYQAVIERVMAAERSVWIATANLKELMVEDPRARPGRRRTLRRGAGAYRSILAVFEEHVARGVEIRLLHAGEPSRPFRAELARRPGLKTTAGAWGAGGFPAGAPSREVRNPLRVPQTIGSFEMRQCPRVHFKAVVIDGAQLYLGSANWTGAGLGAKGEGRRNFELGFVTADDLLLDQVQSLYEEVWRGARCAGCRLRQDCPRPLDRPLDHGPVVRDVRRRKS